MKTFDTYELEYIADRGWSVAPDGLLVLTKQQAEKYTGRSVRDPKVKTLTIPSTHGLCLIFEGEHFRVTG